MGTSATGRYDATNEVRFAVVLYGGVSLAIYMNGITQELLQLVRATAPAPGDDGRLWWDDDDLTGAGPVYRKLGQLLDRNAVGTASGPVRTRFVVDIITGTSAGGINGVFLAKALASDRDISALNDLWVEEGDIERLLNDDGAAAGVPPLRRQKPPLSVLSGQRMLYLLLKALDTVSRTKPRAAVEDAAISPYANQIDLWVTSTDLQGRPVTVETWNPERLGEIREANHRTTFHFRYDATNALLDGDASGAAFNSLGRAHDPLLAFAARCTSSFPGAFQAVQLDDLTEVASGVRGVAAAADGNRGGPDWIEQGDARMDPFFAEYGGTAAAALHSFADGGYLNNQPVDLVMETLPKRRADIPVARRILLVDPDPGGAVIGPPPAPDAIPTDDVPLTGTRVDLLGTLLKVVTLPRVQTIGGDVEKILALREPCRVRSLVYQALDTEFARSSPAAGADADADDRSADPASQVAYVALREATAARELGEGIARIGFPNRQYPAGSQHHAMATRLVSVWMAGQDAGDVLAALDLGFELRRINFLQARIGRRMNHATERDEFDRGSAIRRELDKAFVAAAARARVVRFRGPDPDAAITAIRDQLGAVETEVDFGAPPPELDGALRARLQPGASLRVALDGLMRHFTDQLGLKAWSVATRQALAGDAELDALWDRFAAYDQATLPLRDLLPGENDDIEVLRVSPRDTWRLVDDATRGPKLAGSQVHHFGGFFSADWRRNDILWGRLDAAERLISALWPAAGDPAGRDGLIAEAHAAIIGDVLRDDHYRVLLGRLVPNGLPARPPGPEPVAEGEIQTVIAAIKTRYQPPPPPPAATAVAIATRAARVVDGVARGLPATPGPLQQVRTWLGRVIQVVTGIVELALPTRARSLVGRHLLGVVMVAAVLMIVLGGLVGGPGVTSFGWVVLLTVAGVRLAIGLLSTWLAGRHRTLLIGVGIGAIVVIGFVVYGLASWSGWPRAVALLVVGLAAGTLAGVALAGGRRARRPVATTALAAVLLLGLAASAAGHGHNELSERICRMDDTWYRTVAARVAVVSCGPEVSAT